MEPSSSGRLNSWKEIASYLNASVRTVIRWEKNEGLPVHRHQHGKLALFMPINPNWTAGGRGALILGRRAYQIAILQPGLGNVDAVFGWLNHAGKARSFGIHWLKIDPILDPLRADSRYRQLLKKVNLVD